MIWVPPEVPETPESDDGYPMWQDPEGTWFIMAPIRLGGRGGILYRIYHVRKDHTPYGTFEVKGAVLRKPPTPNANLGKPYGFPTEREARLFIWKGKHLGKA